MNVMHVEKHDFEKQESSIDNNDNVRKLFVERDIFGLEKPKPGRYQPGVAPNKLLIGVLLVFVIIFVAYIVTNVF